MKKLLIATLLAAASTGAMANTQILFDDLGEEVIFVENKQQKYNSCEIREYENMFMKNKGHTAMLAVSPHGMDDVTRLAYVKHNLLDASKGATATLNVGSHSYEMTGNGSSLVTQNNLFNIPVDWTTKVTVEQGMKVVEVKFPSDTTARQNYANCVSKGL
ncbi:hypothetical protein [Vibrio harveyi]|uniref:hypothetical protein n=1 Tax=Vibrio harveyi TaxID=669 RepID=UPI0018F15469|nr:hypothetical protein [Vibrio harveyi]